jgi:glycosyltransferase involved in cell wall biosynthesis
VSARPGAGGAVRGRILLVVNHAGFFLSHRLPHALAAREAGYDVHVATPSSKHVPLIRDHGLPWHELRLTRSGTNPLSEAVALASMARLYRRVRPSVAHHVTSKPVLYGTVAARAAGVPAVVNAISGMGHIFARGGGLARRAVGAGYGVALRHPRMRVLFQNGADRDMFLARRWARPQQAVLIPGSGVDTELFVPGPGGAAAPVVVFPARMLTTKGLMEFVEAARILRARGAAGRFVLVGEPDPDNPASVRLDQLRAWDAEGTVEYWGRRSDMPAVLAGADVACLPSYHEGMPKSLIEAASCGLPIVTTDVPGCRDVVRHGDNGLVVPVRRAPELADALQTLLADAGLRHRMGRRGRERALAEFAMEHVVAQLLGVYAELSG